MHKPSIDLRDPSPDYIRALVERIMKAEGIPQHKVASSLGIQPRQFRTYISDINAATHRECPYLTQFALEIWAESLMEE